MTLPRLSRQVWLVPCIVFVATRALLEGLVRAAPAILPVLHINRPSLPHSDPLAAAWSWTSPWFRFDARWWVDVVNHGYHWGKAGQANTNFLPAFPVLTRLVAPLVGGSAWLAGWLVSNLALLLAMVLLWEWSRRRWGLDVALRVLLLTAAFPFAFFFSAPYAESLFLAFAVLAFLMAEDQRWELAALASGLCVITRPVAPALLLGLFVLALQQRSRKGVLLMAAAGVPALAYMAYLGVSLGHPLGIAIYHSYGWVPPHGGLFETISSQFHTQLSPFDRVDAAISVLFLASGVLAWRMLGAPYGLFVLGGVALPLTHGLVGMERYVIVLFPAIATWAVWSNKLGQVAIFVASVVGLVTATVMFADGYSIF